MQVPTHGMTMIVCANSWGLHIVIATDIYGLVVVKLQNPPHVEIHPRKVKRIEIVSINQSEATFESEERMGSNSLSINDRNND